MKIHEESCPSCKQDYVGLSIVSSYELGVSRIECSECGWDFSGECCEEDLISKFKAKYKQKTCTNPSKQLNGVECVKSNERLRNNKHIRVKE